MDQSLKSILSVELLAESVAGRDSPLLTDKVTHQLLDDAWIKISKEFSIASPKPIAFIVGAGDGAPRANALRNIAQDIFHRIRCLYDVSHLSLSRVNNLIEQCHQSAQPTIVIHITQPLIKSAGTVISEMILAGIVPSASEFALSHFNSLNTFIAVAKRHKKKTSLFAASIIQYEKAQIHHHNNLRLFNQTNADLANYEQTFVTVWKAHKGQQRPSSQVIKIKPAHAPKRLKNLNHTASFVSHVLCVTLRSNLRTPTKTDIGRDSLTTQHAVSVTGVAPAQLLAHTRVSGSQDVLNKVANWRQVTAEGQEELLNDERPERIVVREKLTHPHEMETLRVR